MMLYIQISIYYRIHELEIVALTRCNGSEITELHVAKESAFKDISHIEGNGPHDDFSYMNIELPYCTYGMTPI
jgi:hypothetical protein